jgi:hypothetical protein
MNENQKPVNEMNQEEIRAWLKRRQQSPIYTGSDEQEGMSLCYVNPSLVHDADENPGEEPSNESR